MKFIPGDVVTYINKTTKYRIELNPRGALHMRHCLHGGEYSVPANGRLIKVGHDTTYRVPIENIRKYMSLVSSDCISPEMRRFVDMRMGGHKSGMDTSGFDVIQILNKKVPSNDAVDALSYAMRGSFGISKGSMSGDSTAAGINARLNQNIIKENKMSIQINDLVAKVTDNIKDAQLVTYYFGHELKENSIKDEYFVKDNYDALLIEAKDREEKRLHALEKSYA